MRKSIKAVLSTIFVMLLISSTMIVTLAVGNISSLKATSVTHKSATITWKAASGADGYELSYTTGSTTKKVTIKGKSTTSYKLTLTPGKSYTVKVKSYDKPLIGKTKYGKEYKITVKAVPAAVKNFKATALAGGTSLKFTWSKVSGVTGYTVYRYSSSKKAYVSCGSTTGSSLTVKGLYAGTAYKFRIAAYYKYSGKNIYGSYTNITATPTYLAPTSFKVTKTATNSLTFSWTAASGAKSYTVYRYSASKKAYVSCGSTTGTSLTVKGLYTGTEYQFKVRGYTKSGSKTVYGNYSSVITATTLPAAVTGLTTSNLTQKGVDIAFDKAKGALGYQVFLYDYETGKETKLIKQLTTNTYSITGLEAGKTYRIRVHSYVKNSGTYFYSAKSTIYIDTPPALSAGTAENAKDILVQWGEVRKAASYKLERYVHKEYKWTTVADITAETVYTGNKPSANKVSYLDAGLGENNAELYRLTAYNASGAVINTVEQTVANKGVKFAQNDYSATISWNAPAGISKYTVYKMPLEGYQNYNMWVYDFEIANPDTDKYTFYLTPNEYCSYMIYANADIGGQGGAVATFTAHAGKLIIDSSNESKNAQLLLLVNAINKAKVYKGDVKVKTDSYAKMVLEAIYFSEEMAKKIPGSSLLLNNGEISAKDLEAFFKLLVGLGAADESDIPEIVTEEDPAPVTYNFSGGYATSETGSKINLRTYIEPSGTSDKLAFLFNQHKPSSWKNGFSSVSTTYYPESGKYKVVATLKQEKFGTSTSNKEANYHPGFVSVYDALGFSGEGVDNDLTTLGATKITAYIDAEGRIYNYTFTSPFTTKFMASDGADSGVGMKMSGTTTIKYNLSF